MTPFARSTTGIGALIALIAGLIGPAFAGEHYDVILANRLVCRLRDAGGYGSVSERGSAVEKNIVEALSVENVGNPKMRLESAGGLPAIYIGRTFLVQVRPGDAAGTDSSVSSLARQWLAAFKQQFPRAEPVTKMGRGGGGLAASAGGSGPAPPRRQPVVVPDGDKALVAEVERLLTDGRNLPAEEFEPKGLAVATEMTALIWRTSAGATICADFDALDGRDQAVQSALNGLKHAREMADQAFNDQRTLIALTLAKRLRTALPPSS